MLFFHHNNRRFEPGEVIVGNHYDIRPEVLYVYHLC